MARSADSLSLLGLGACRFWPPWASACCHVTRARLDDRSRWLRFLKRVQMHQARCAEIKQWCRQDKSNVDLSCTRPLRCTQQELEAFLIDLVPGTMKLTVPKSQSGRNRGYAFVRAAEITVQQLVSALWRKCVPTRKSTRPLKLQPANMHKMKVSQ